MKNIALVLLGILCFSQMYAQPGFKPAGVPDYLYETFASSSCQNLMVSPTSLGVVGPQAPHLVVMGDNGFPVWYKPIDRTRTNWLDGFIADFKRVDDSLYCFAILDGSFNSTKYIILDLAFNAVDTVVAPAPYDLDLHDLIRMPDGSWIIIGLEGRIKDLSHLSFNGQQMSSQTNVTGNLIIHLDQSGNQLSAWNSFDHVDESECYEDYVDDTSSIDPVHINSVELDNDGMFLVSCRSTDQVLKLDLANDSVIWRLGGVLNDFSFVGDSGFSAQHDFRRLPNGRVSVFDNANRNNGPSYLKEYTLDEVGFAATLAYHKPYDSTFRASAMGNYQLTSDGERVASWGGNPLTVYNAADSLAILFRFTPGYASYRMVCDDLSSVLNRPQINCSDSNRTLSLGQSSDDVLWHNGDTLNAIAINDTGWYLAYVSRGIGMIAAEPYYISDTSDPCGLRTDIDHTDFQLQDVALYPMPNSGAFFISMPSALELSSLFAIDISGRRHSLPIELQQGVYQVNMESFPKGHYILQLECTDGTRFHLRQLKY